MPVVVRSFGKINIGLLIGDRNDDGFHELRTIYHTIALHDVVRVESRAGGAPGRMVSCDGRRDRRAAPARADRPEH